VLIERWRRHYNTLRPHSALGYRPPAPETILPHAADLASAAQGLRADRHFKDGLKSLNQRVVLNQGAGHQQFDHLNQEHEVVPISASGHNRTYREVARHVRMRLRG